MKLFKLKKEIIDNYQINQYKPILINWLNLDQFHTMSVESHDKKCQLKIMKIEEAVV
jgi:hypothetical protein